MKQFWNELPVWGKAIVIALIILAIYIIYRKIKQAIEATNYTTPVNQAQTSLNELAKKGILPSFSQAEYTTSANSLQIVLDGCTLAKDSDSGWSIIEGIFKKLKNEADVYALIKAYGVKVTDKCGLFTGDLEADLATTLTEHLTGSEAFIIRHNLADINSILKSKGIVYSF